MTLPFCFYYEGNDVITNAVTMMSLSKPFMYDVIGCGLCFYIYNEMQNVVLGSLGPVSTAVGNTLKRVAIFVALYMFTEGETFPMPKIVGCAIAIAGCLAYAIFDSKKL